MSAITPSSPEELAQVLAEAASQSRPVCLLGRNSKRLMGGPITSSGATISTIGLRQILQYEPNDLTISVEAGLPFAELQATLAKHGQMIALDPPFWSEATVGGVVATNSNGPMRRAFGTARDLIIGMTFATLEGKLIKSGGMVVKNVAGLDMAKLLIGSFGTLAAITTVNFRVHSMSEETRSFLFSFPDVERAMEKCDAILRSVLQPVAVDLLSPVAAARVGRRGYLVAVRAGGSRAVLDRYGRELDGAEILNADTEFWQQTREFTPEFMRRNPSGVVLRISTRLGDISNVLRMSPGPVVSRAGSGVTYVYLSSWQPVAALWKASQENGWSVVVEFASDEIRQAKELWLQPTSVARENAFDMMKQVKQMFDPANLLNTSRLYGRI
ncbi:MAG: FAD-binding oxidoreductase [Acidobacteriota bacterium]|nr:FAD-binding oxidoreductase [Acidobacteriota bacterium]